MKGNHKFGAVLGLLVLSRAGASPPAQIVETNTFIVDRAIPDGNAAGMSDVQAIGSKISKIAEVKVKLRIAGEFNGDLYVYLRHGDAELYSSATDKANMSGALA
jgi:hypothetical protein